MGSPRDPRTGCRDRRLPSDYHPVPGRDRAVTVRAARSVGGIFDPIADRIDVFAQLADFHVQHGNIFLKEAQTFVQAINPCAEGRESGVQENGQGEGRFR